MAIPGTFVLEQLGAVLALEGQVLGVALQEEKERRRCTIRAAVQRAKRESVWEWMICLYPSKCLISASDSPAAD